MKQFVSLDAAGMGAMAAPFSIASALLVIAGLPWIAASLSLAFLFAAWTAVRHGRSIAYAERSVQAVLAVSADTGR